MTARIEKCAVPLAALALSATVFAGVCCMPASAYASSFGDVGGHWAEDDGWIDYASLNGLMTGYDDSNRFGPDDPLTRGMVATVLYRLAGGTPVGDSGFPDVEQGIWYSDAIVWCKANGIITGYPEDGTFRPNEQVLRAELATMAYRFAAWAGIDVSASDAAYYLTQDTGLIDRPNNAFSYARSALIWTCDTGVLNGKYDTEGFAWLDAQYTATRGEAAKIFSVLKRDVVDRSGSYTVLFDPAGGSEVAAQGVASGTKASRPADPTREGYTFVNWYSDKALTRVFNFSSNVTGNVTAYAKWQSDTSAHDGEIDEVTAVADEPTYDTVAPEFDLVAPAEPDASTGGVASEPPLEYAPTYDDVEGGAESGSEGEEGGSEADAGTLDASQVASEESVA